MHWSPFAMIAHRYAEQFGAALRPAHASYLQTGQSARSGAALGFTRAADTTALFLERYLDAPVEACVGAAIGRPVPRAAIVEIGNFAAGHALPMIRLWAATANDLGGASEVVVATLTAPLRATFARIGVPVHAMAPALPARAGDDAAAWGRYYEAEPWVCCGEIAAGQAALARFTARRNAGR